ncbi:hypothetical protein PPACK8108_LOCUS1247 [Phakopsora pachyrhizi]|uniref:Uncharacterized protein n=1 Tax=Phakopsora pachyrhizi TaxID=170000 RepID=A0AAV0AI59_PHAPC|nr:hypothetical protein PPACK8108_LOCUS1247 [Phakopsora pachyrhizi]
MLLMFLYKFILFIDVGIITYLFLYFILFYYFILFILFYFIFIFFIFGFILF